VRSVRGFISSIRLIHPLAGNPLRSAQLIHELSLYHSIFSVVPGGVKSWLPDVFLTHDPDCALAASSVLYALITQEDSPLPLSHPSLVSIIHEDSSAKARLFLAALLFPYMGKNFTDSKNKSVPIVGAVIRESLKLGVQNHFLDGIPVLYSAVPLITSHMKDHFTQPLDRARLGLLLRNKLVHNPNTGTHWTMSFLFSLVTELVPVYNVSEDSFDGMVFFLPHKILTLLICSK
jgi:tRNA nucleotidyltransferase (CCA-adding enzyme)